MPLYSYRGNRPRLGPGAFVAPGAVVVGDVEAGADVSIWFGSVVRGDVNAIAIGERSNVQDGCVLHVTHDEHALTIGADVVIGHGAVLHGCRVEDGALVGIGARVLDGAVIERCAQLGAGAVAAPGFVLPEGHLGLGVPARVARPLTDAERRQIEAIGERYVALKDEYRERLGSGLEVVA